MQIKVNYLNNKELLKEIHRSKNTYSSYTRPEYADYDYIVRDLSTITKSIIEEIKAKKAKLIVEAARAGFKEKGIKNFQLPVVDPQSIPESSIVIRLMTHDHIPLEPNRKSKPKTVDDLHAKCNFKPFKHFLIESYDVDENGEYTNFKFEEVGRSHWIGSLSNGHFSIDHGKTTDRLAMMFMKLVDKYSQRANWRRYTYLDEMKSQALLQLSSMGLQFDESRSDNPFSYMTSTVTNSFTRVFNVEKKNQNIRDDLFIMSGQNPSSTRQLDNYLEQKKEFDKDS